MLGNGVRCLAVLLRDGTKSQCVCFCGALVAINPNQSSAAVTEIADNGLRLSLNEGERGSDDDLPC